MPASRPRSLSLLRYTSGACALLALVGLGGCQDDTSMSAFAPACPRFDVPGSIADRFDYDGKGIDTSHLVSHTQITGVNGDCREGPKDSHGRPLTRVRISLALNQQRGPASTSKTETIPYFVAILHEGSIVDKKTFSDSLKMPSSRTAQQINTPLRFIDLPTGDNPQVSPYTLEIGFQLSRDELDYNRHHLTHQARFEDHVE